MTDHTHDHVHEYAVMSGEARAAAVAQAGELAAEKRVSFTPQRKAVYELLLTAGRPIGAYALMEELAKQENRGVAPPTIYRALDFLQELGVVSRLESSNEFIPCTHPSEPHDCIFLICTCCKKAVETDERSIHGALTTLADKHGFKTGRQVIELQGLCKACR